MPLVGDDESRVGATADDAGRIRDRESGTAASGPLPDGSGTAAEGGGGRAGPRTPADGGAGEAAAPGGGGGGRGAGVAATGRSDGTSARPDDADGTVGLGILDSTGDRADDWETSDAGSGPDGDGGRGGSDPAGGDESAGAGPDAEPDPEPVPGPARRKRRRRRRVRAVLVSMLVMILSLILLAAVGVWWFIDHYASKVDRIENVFPATANQPPRGKGTNFVLVGLDSRADMPTTGRGAKGPLWQEGAQRSDATMLLHISANREQVYVVAIPRDSWVTIPGRGDAKINAAFSWGGPPMLIDTVQQLTQVRVDHFAAIDWDGFKRLTDALGGVDVEIAQDIPQDGDARGWTAGTHHMNGEDALMYVRERKGLPRGDLDRVERQQNFMRSVMEKLLSKGTLDDPLGLPDLLDALTSSISVDDRMSNGDLRDLVWSMRRVHGDDVTFMTAPVSELKTIQGQDAAVLAPEQSAFLWQTLREDSMDLYLRRYPNATLPEPSMVD
jgi:LCP family protein required for cell wall assembly